LEENEREAAVFQDAPFYWQTGARIPPPAPFLLCWFSRSLGNVESVACYPLKFRLACHSFASLSICSRSIPPPVWRRREATSRTSPLPLIPISQTIPLFWGTATVVLNRYFQSNPERESTISRYARINFMECRNFSMSSSVKAPMFPIRKNLLSKDPMPA